MRGLRTLCVAVLTCAAAGALGGCSAAPDQTTPSPTPALGGTLRLGFAGSALDLAALYVDPAADTAPKEGQLMPCCLARTLLTYPGRPTIEGGAVLQPDLAMEMPNVAADGLAWTFHLRHGIHYAPPYDQTEVEAADFIRAVERHARLRPDYAFGGPYWFVAGAGEFAGGNSATITGLEAPDRYTLVVRLSQPYGAMSALADFSWAPIPAALASGHDDDLARFWASTGPYMYETYPADASSGKVVLVRNPSWDRATDARRGAWVDRIEVTAIDPAVIYDALELDEIDLVTGSAPGAVINHWRSEASLASRVRATGSESLQWLPMNLAVPPFDDVAVRRAVNAVLNRAALSDLIVAARTTDRGPQRNALINGHVFPDSLTDGLLVDYDPFPSRGHTGDVGRAKTEMSSSRYDIDHDGMCDADVCQGVVMPVPDPAIGEAVRADLAQIGLQVEVVELSDSNDMGRPANHTALAIFPFLWGFTLAGDDLTQLLRDDNGGLTDDDGLTLDTSLLGATPSDLTALGYSVTDVPGVSDVIDRCAIESGHRRARCWAELDQLVTEVAVPWVPLFSFESAQVSSTAVLDFDIDQTAGYVALDNVVLAPQR